VSIEIKGAYIANNAHAHDLTGVEDIKFAGNGP
jgi:hypothetical protein